MKIDFSRMKEGKNGALASFGFMTMGTTFLFFLIPRDSCLCCSAGVQMPITS